VRLLLSSGCGANRADLTGSSALITSVRQGHTEAASTLASHSGVDLEWTDNERRTALIVAAQLGNSDILRCLINAGAH